MSQRVMHIPESIISGKRLGRHIEHDSSSHAFRLDVIGPIVTKLWTRHCAPFDQGDLGSCTGNACTGALMTGPLFRTGRMLGEKDAVRLYSVATTLDSIPGSYPPNDTGSSGLAVAKAAQKLGYISGYKHPMGLQAALYALTLGPVIAGIGWYEGFDSPIGHNAEIQISGSLRGGHEVEVLGVDTVAKTILICNSWGSSWGNHGYCTMSWDTFDRLLEEEGDVIAMQA